MNENLDLILIVVCCLFFLLAWYYLNASLNESRRGNARLFQIESQLANIYDLKRRTSDFFRTLHTQEETKKGVYVEAQAQKRTRKPKEDKEGKLF